MTTGPRASAWPENERPPSFWTSSGNRALDGRGVKWSRLEPIKRPLPFIRSRNTRIGVAFLGQETFTMASHIETDDSDLDQHYQTYRNFVFWVMVFAGHALLILALMAIFLT
jgi:hypothetical protein